MDEVLRESELVSNILKTEKNNYQTLKYLSIMKKFYTIVLLAAVIAVAAGCSKKTYYQVYQTKPVNAESIVTADSKLVHESADCLVRYNFFAEEGDAGFWFTNLTDSVIYVDLAETFFVINGNANEYFQARQWTTTKSSTISISKQEKSNKGKKKQIDATEGSSQTSTKASTFGERRVIAIPPHATKYFSEFTIIKSDMTLCGVKDTPKRSKPEGSSFTIENTPMTFGNFITYTVGCKGNRKHLDDNFYVSEIINVNGEAMFESVREKDACGREKGEKVQQMRYATPDRFYVIYKR